MIPEDVRAFLFIIANSDSALIEYRRAAKELLDKYTRPAKIGPSEFKDTTTITPMWKWD